VLWDCIALLDPATEALVRALGGLAAIAISHSHYYTTMRDWAEAFEAPIHLHAADRDWVVRPHKSIRFWEGETLEIMPGVTLICAGGHFPGGTVLHWAEGAGTLLVGDGSVKNLGRYAASWSAGWSNRPSSTAALT